jgi:iron complex outermembrane receptor protein
VTKSIHTLALCAGGFVVLWTSDAQAQATVVDSQLEEIVVTAQRRQQSLQDVPISAAVFSGELIQQSRWTGARDFVQMTPNVTYAEEDRQSMKNGYINIRGISDLTSGGNSTIIESRPAIAYTVDDFNVGFVASGAANPPLNDVERIEILRGPQSTFFGRTSAGGAVNVITRKPGPTTEVEVSAGAGNFGTYNLGALANVPLTDNLFARGAISYEKSDGYIDNLSPSGNRSGWDYTNLRTALRWQPRNWVIDLAVQRIIENEGVQPWIGTGVNPSGFLNSAPGGPSSPQATCGLGTAIYFQNGNDSNICVAGQGYGEIVNNLGTVRALYEADRFSFTSVTGHIDGKINQNQRIDKTGVDVFSALVAGHTDSFSQEIQLASAGDWKLWNRPYTWLFGAIYYNDNSKRQNTIVVGGGAAPGFIGAITVPTDHPNENIQSVDQSGGAAYFNVSWDVKDSVTLQVGGRYSYDKSRQNWTETYASFACGTRAVINGVPAPLRAGCFPRPDQLPLTIYTNSAGAQFVTAGRFAQRLFTDGSKAGSDFSPRVALNWKARPGHNLYLAWSQGYRAPGIRLSPDANTIAQQLGTAPPVDTRSSYKKENIDNYELGWKGLLNDQRTRFEIAIFDMEWRDMQVRTITFACTLADGTVVDANDPRSVGCVTGPQANNRIRNAPAARSRGVEASIQALLSDHFEAAAALGLLDAKFTDFPNSTVGDVTGQRMPAAPSVTAAASLQYNWTLGSTKGFWRIDGSHRNSMYTRQQDVFRPQFPYQTGPVTLMNLQAGVSRGGQSLTLNVNNVFDKQYASGVDDFSGIGAAVLPHPRVIAVTWQAKMGL